jgi:hypothetical protein
MLAQFTVYPQGIFSKGVTMRRQEYTIFKEISQ